MEVQVRAPMWAPLGFGPLSSLDQSERRSLANALVDGLRWVNGQLGLGERVEALREPGSEQRRRVRRTGTGRRDGAEAAKVEGGQTRVNRQWVKHCHCGQLPRAVLSSPCLPAMGAPASVNWVSLSFMFFNHLFGRNLRYSF